MRRPPERSASRRRHRLGHRGAVRATVAYSLGSYSRSASCTMTKSLVAARNPRRSAAPFPRLRGWHSTRTRESTAATASASSRLVSEEPSSTTNTSAVYGDASTRSRVRRRVAASLKQGTTTDTQGVSESGTEGVSPMRWDRANVARGARFIKASVERRAKRSAAAMRRVPLHLRGTWAYASRSEGTDGRWVGRRAESH